MKRVIVCPVSFDFNETALPPPQEMIVDCSSLSSSLSLNTNRSEIHSIPPSLSLFVSSLLKYSGTIREFRLNGNRLSDQLIDVLFEQVFPFLRYMDLLDISFLSLSFRSLNNLCHMMNPSAFGYCPILHLNISRASLGVKGSQQLFESLSGNITIKELLINGNGLTDKSLPPLVTILKNPDNILEILGISHNEITTEGMKLLSPVIGSHKHLKKLYLDGNPIQSEGAECLFSCIWRSQMVTISMSYCNLTTSEWSSSLIYMTSLESLLLSYNQIDGLSLQVLCDSLQRCACIRHLNLSYNQLDNIQAGCIGQLIKIHKGLISINLSGNNLPSEVISAIVLGIYGNCTLRTLNLSWCNLRAHDASLLCTALAQNSLLELNLQFNPIPDNLRDEPRKSSPYLERRQLIENHFQSLEKDGTNRLESTKLIQSILKTSIVTASNSGAVAEEEEHVEFAFVDELSAEIAAELWRQQRLKKIIESEKAYNDMNEIRNEKKDTEQEIDSTERIFDQTAQQQQHDLEEKQRNELKLHLEPTAAAELAKKHIISTQSTLIDVIDGKFILTVSYGRRNEVIGTVEVTEKMTYYETRELIIPLLRSYFETSDVLYLQNALHFKLLDGLGFVLTEEAERVRIAWAELSTSGHCLHIQPADWLYIPKEE